MAFSARPTSTRLILVLSLLLLAACQPAGRSSSSDTLLVFAAASLTDAFQELGATFEEQNPGSEIRFNFAGSQQLSQQILGGAPGDVFASADLAQMQVLVAGNHVSDRDVQPITANRLVVVYPTENPAQLQSIRDLARPGLRLVLPAAEVPAGRYTLRFLDNAAAEFGPAFRRQVLANVVSYELNVRAVLTKVTLGEADAGIVYSSDVVGSDRSDSLGWLHIPDALNILAVYYLAPLVQSADNPLAGEFVAFVLSDEGQATLQRYGFTPSSSNSLE